MITETQIIEAAKECGYARTKPHKAMILLAQRCYQLGLLDAAEKCASLPSYEFDGYEDRTTWPCDCAEAIRQMADEVGK